jgi:2-dehydro-3-deoxygluconokinase
VNKSELVFDRLKRGRLVALLSPDSAAQALSVFEALDPLGVTLEVAFRTEAASDAVRTILARHPRALVLAGTVMTKAQAEAAIAAGAAGVVSADFIPAVVEACVASDVMCLPGGLADAGKQLVLKAELYGCSLAALKADRPYQYAYKLFPALSGSQDNTGLASAWRGPFKDLTVVYAGGVTLANLPALSSRDPEGIFCASALAERKDEPEAVAEEARRWISALVGAAKPASVRSAEDARLEKPQAAGSGRVVAFGEVLLRLSPPNFERLSQARSFEAFFGGAELNVACALAQFGLPVRFVTAIPPHDLGRAAESFLRSFGVDTSFVLRQGKRLGVYYLENGASQRPSQVIYDRAGSAVAQADPGAFAWDKILDGAAWFHWSGITPALSPSAAAATAQAVRAAKRAGATVSVDLNYRSKLWSKEAARATIVPLMEFTDIVFGNEEDAADIFGVAVLRSDASAGTLDPEGYRAAAEELARRFGFRKVAFTLRQSLSASVNRWSGCLWNGREFLRSRTYEIQVIDRVGSGDAFSAGFIWGHLAGKPDPEALEFAAAASCLKHATPGDVSRATVEEVEALAAGTGSGRIKR